MTKSGMNIEQRDIILIPFPYTDLLTIKKRPVLVLSNFYYHKNNNDMICCAITSSKKQIHNGIKIENKDLEKGQLKTHSTIKPSKIFTILRSITIKKIGKLNLEKTKEVIKSLNLEINLY